MLIMHFCNFILLTRSIYNKLNILHINCYSVLFMLMHSTLTMMNLSNNLSYKLTNDETHFLYLMTNEKIT